MSFTAILVVIFVQQSLQTLLILMAATASVMLHEEISDKVGEYIDWCYENADEDT